MNKDELLSLANNIIDNNNIAMVATNAPKGYPNVRALTTMKREGLELFYFSTRADSNKVKQMKKNARGSIYYYDEKTYQTVMLEGKYKVEPNRDFDVSDIYKIDQVDPYDFATIKFYTESIYVYSHFQTAKVSVKEVS